MPNATTLWRRGSPGKTVSGANAVWLMNGMTVLGKRNLSTPKPI